MAHAREPALDGLRALAALMVALVHCLFAVGMPSGMREDLLDGIAGALANGNSAVVLFFVLSGYVLGASFARDPSPGGALGFLARRVLRIYPAWLVALGASWLATLAYSYPGTDGAGGAYRSGLVLVADGGVVLRAALWPSIAGGLVPPAWTLPIELVLSFAMPLLFVLARRWRGGILLLLAIASLAVPPRWRAVSYSFPFVLGLLVERGIEVSARGRVASLALTAMAMVAFFLPPNLVWPLSPAAGIALPSLGALVLLLRARSAPSWQRVLGSKVLARLGEISYGFYLNHCTVLRLLAPFVLLGAEAATVTSAVARWLVLAGVVVPLSCVAAAASYRWIEAPSMRAGRALATRIGMRSASPPKFPA